MRRLVWIISATFIFATPAFAEDKVDAKKLKGSWTREVESFEITYKFKDDKTMQAIVGQSGGDQRIVVDIEYTLDKDGKLTGTVSKVDGNDGPQIGEKFSFKIEFGKDSIKICDFEGIGDDNVKRLIEGEYKKKVD